MNVGKVVQVIGPVVDVEFPAGTLPSIYNAVKISIDGEGAKAARELTAEVALHLGDNVVRLITLGPTDGLKRGAVATGHGRAHFGPGGPGLFGPADERVGRTQRLSRRHRGQRNVSHPSADPVVYRSGNHPVKSLKPASKSLICWNPT
jgi:F0F1-type ATP synthase beta subunit